MTTNDNEKRPRARSVSSDERTIGASALPESVPKDNEVESVSVVVEPSQAEIDNAFPDGGLRAWLVVLGSACGTMATFGFVNAWGIFQAYYEDTLLSTTSPSTIAWIGSVQYALVFIPGLVFGRLFDMGYLKIPLLLSSIVLVVAIFLVAECTQYWHFLLCQGIVVGVACGIIFGPVIGVIAHWFKRRLGLALGFVALGSSIGGTLFPIATHNLIERVGFRWTMRILGFLVLFILVICNLTVERRLPPRQHSGPFLKPQAFKSPAYTIYTMSSFVVFLGLYTVLTYIDVSAQQAGVQENLTFYLLSIANACSSLGRVGAGILVDKLGPLNVMIPFTLIAGILTYAWPYAKTAGDYIAIAILYGISSGVYVSMITAPIVRMGETHDVGVRVGMFLTVLAFGALAGPPISGAINVATGNYKMVGVFAGTTVVIACAMMLVVRQILLGGRWRGKC